MSAFDRHWRAAVLGMNEDSALILQNRQKLPSATCAAASLRKHRFRTKNAEVFGRLLRQPQIAKLPNPNALHCPHQPIRLFPMPTQRNKPPLPTKQPHFLARHRLLKRNGNALQNSSPRVRRQRKPIKLAHSHPSQAWKQISGRRNNPIPRNLKTLRLQNRQRPQRPLPNPLRLLRNRREHRIRLAGRKRLQSKSPIPVAVMRMPKFQSPVLLKTSRIRFAGSSTSMSPVFSIRCSRFFPP